MSIYHPSIPQAGDDPTHSQADLLDNFQKLNADFSVNHLPFTSGGNAGWHRLIQFIGKVPTPGNTSGPKSALYPHESIVTPLTPTDAAELLFKNTNTRVQLTNIPPSINGGGNRFGFKTPWGFTLNFGHAEFDGATAKVFPVAFSATPFAILATAQGNSGVPIAIKSVSATEFIGVGSGNPTCFFFAIGLSTPD